MPDSIEMKLRHRFVQKAPAKINLYLKITGRRPDGYHDLVTLMQKVSLFDELVFERCSGGIYLACSQAGLPTDKGNLVYSAAELFFRTVGWRIKESERGVAITLNKIIPVAAGLGGGSSDAAATLLGLNTFFDCSCSDEELAAMGLQLGADVPFFLAESAACLGEGIGEILSPVDPVHGYDVVLVNPGFPVSTQWAYQTFALTNHGRAGNLKNLQIMKDSAGSRGKPAWASFFLMNACNDLELVTLQRYPEIDQIKSEILAHGAAVAMMSGSGPTVFGLFKERQAAETSQLAFKGRFAQTYLVSPLSGDR